MAQPKITLYVVIVSPFGYIAFYILKVCLLHREKEKKGGRGDVWEMGDEC